MLAARCGGQVWGAGVEVRRLFELPTQPPFLCPSSGPSLSATDSLMALMAAFAGRKIQLNTPLNSNYKDVFFHKK